MTLKQIIQECTLEEIMLRYPIAEDFFDNYRLNHINKRKSLRFALDEVDEEILIDFAVTAEEIYSEFLLFLNDFAEPSQSLRKISSITIHGGKNKFNEPENQKITISVGEVVSIVGPTGSGKSRLLEDIECLAQGDTPTARHILLDNMPVDDDTRFELDGKLVAQLSQNMNFIMDLTVKEFLDMHARCRIKENHEITVNKCFYYANMLAGEKFTLDTKVTQLSGGQSRALMIADTAFMSDSPIILVDEIENAGINRKEAIGLLAKREKIILISTHDPLLALYADKRIVIKNGGIEKLIETNECEKESLKDIEKLDNILLNIREDLRAGKTITTNLKGE